MTERSKEPAGYANEPTSTGDSAPGPQTPPASEAVSPEKQKASRRRRVLLGAGGAVVLAAVLAVGIPWILNALNTESTDDAYVNGHVTFVAPRVRGQVGRVLVDDNNRVHKGDLLVELDKEPYRTAVAIAKEQGARTYELLASLSLSKLYQSTNRHLEAHAILAPALEGFAPTPEMPEIAEAQALMKRLA